MDIIISANEKILHMICKSEERLLENMTFDECERWIHNITKSEIKGENDV